MAVDLYSDNPTSPRISFSYDLSQHDTVPVEQLLRTFSSSSVDFNFCVHENTGPHQPSMADELFFDGKMLPTEVRPKINSYKMTPTPPPQRPKHDYNHLRATNKQEDEEEELNLNLKQNNTKSFWGFKRSSSCGNGYARSLCPITLLSRSHSTGSSTTSSKRSSSSCSKDGFSQKPSRSFQKPSGSQKPPLRKSGYGYGNGNGNGTGNGIRVNPVLNLGFGSFFSSNSKGKTKK